LRAIAQGFAVSAQPNGAVAKPIALLEILGTQLIGRPAIAINPVCGDKDVQTVAKFLNPK
jgi:hypothetical protein